MSLTDSEISSQLLRLYADRESAQILDLARISDGWETDVYAFAVEHDQASGREREELILRLYPGDDAVGKSAREFSAMGKLYQLGYPVPRVVRLEQGSALLGKPFVVMEKIDGCLLTCTHSTGGPSRSIHRCTRRSVRMRQCVTNCHTGRGTRTLSSSTRSTPCSPGSESGCLVSSSGHPL